MTEGAAWLVKTAGIDFPGWDATNSYLIAEVEMDEEPQIGMRPEGGGLGPVNPAAGGGPYGVVLLEKQVEHAGEPTLEEVREALVAAYGTDFGMHSPTWISRFTDATPSGGDLSPGQGPVGGGRRPCAWAAGGTGSQHRSPGRSEPGVEAGAGGCRRITGVTPRQLHAERHPVSTRVLQNTMAQVALARIDERSQALRATMLELLAMDEPRRRIAGMISALDIHYDFGEGHPLLGRRMPDLDLDTIDGTTRVFSLLHDAHGVLLSFGTGASLDITRWGVDSSGRSPIRRQLGAPRPRRGRCAVSGTDPTRRSCRLDGHPHRPRPTAGSPHLVPGRRLKTRSVKVRAAESGQNLHRTVVRRRSRPGSPRCEAGCRHLSATISSGFRPYALASMGRFSR